MHQSGAIVEGLAAGGGCESTFRFSTAGSPGFAEGYEGKIDGAGNLASAYYCAFQSGTSTWLLDRAEEKKKKAATFVSPYPPGYPILVPGQVITDECVEYLRSPLDMGVGVGDIHGLHDTKGSRAFR